MILDILTLIVSLLYCGVAWFGFFVALGLLIWILYENRKSKRYYK